MTVEHMKILQINNYHYLRGGSERSYLDTSVLLKEKGHHVINFSVNDTKALPDPNKDLFVKPIDYNISAIFKRIKAASLFIYSIEAREKLEELIRRNKPDIAHLHIFYGRLTSSILPLLKKHGIPCVMTVHEYRMLCPVYTFLDGQNNICELCAAGSYWHCAAKRCNRLKLSYSVLSALECYVRDYLFTYEKYIDKFIMVSDFIANKHLEYRSGLQSKIIGISNFADLKTDEHCFPPDDYYLYFGRLSREKGLLTLLSACEQIPQMNLYLAGDGDLKKMISEYVAARNISRVRLLGHLTGEQLTSAIKRSRYIVVPSEWYENRPMSIIEAQCYGKPVIGADIGGIPEMIKDQTNGYLFKSGDIQSLVKTIHSSMTISPDAYGKMSEESEKYADQHYNKTLYYEKLMKVYEEAVAAANG